ncbi:nucleoside triphosphate pyrophosphohydrolase [Acetobacteraceae bacterium KSS12]|uniref:Nucleoside triphosphate pyrophosphohydrolase n=2 Tax=Rhizosaccharibacter radicis TaxID=2782605 RepID=A0ABT1VYQ4_9PROT|nr:nucleoside triphosphate pyrophosphohydrolase [Acetobacteraceae bacterium KSS12]
MARLRDPATGCPWDRDQDFDSIAPYTIEEAYEVADAIARRDWPALVDELGDLLLQIVYYARMAEEDGRFTFADIARSVADKMVRRHPHVFGEEHFTDDTWEDRKAAERAGTGRPGGTLSGVTHSLPALDVSVKLGKRAARTGFDWPGPEPVLAKLDEEIAELRHEIAVQDADRCEAELGDVLFTLGQLARKLKLDPEASLRRSNRSFVTRFTAMEAAVEASGRSMSGLPLAELEAEWQAVKRKLAEPEG